MIQLYSTKYIQFRQTTIFGELVNLIGITYAGKINRSPRKVDTFEESMIFVSFLQEIRDIYVILHCSGSADQPKENSLFVVGIIGYYVSHCLSLLVG